MTEKSKSNTANKTVFSRLDYSWYMAGAYLDMLRSFGNFSKDEEFNKLFGALRDYVDKKFFSQCEGKINNIFVIAEQTINSTE